jgi:uncharacterized protein (DUF58 family)
VALFTLGYGWSFFVGVAKTALVLIGAAVVTDMYLIYRLGRVEATRVTGDYFSLGDENPVELHLSNQFPFRVKFVVIDEVPEQFQWRNVQFSSILKAGQQEVVRYELRPVTRGWYRFYHINIIAGSPLGLIQRRMIEGDEISLKVYPSIQQMRQYELMAFSDISRFSGIKKIRRIGHSYEFEQIRNYVAGDDFRSINWKATARSGDLMVNQFQDEKSQQVYSFLDKGRNMKMPFNGLSLIDYAINSALMISNVALKKGDKAGLLSFSEVTEKFIKADSSATQLNKLLESLFAERETRQEPNFEGMYAEVQQRIPNRSLIFLFTNFETVHAAKRVIPVLKKIQTRHLLVVVFFENTELVEFSQNRPKDLMAMYEQTIAEKFIHEKKRIARELNLLGIQTILTKPEDLSINTLNKYLELKARGLI